MNFEIIFFDMKILLCFDEGYAAHAATLMEQLIDQASAPLGFVIMHGNSISEPTIARLRDHFAPRVASIEFHGVGAELTADMARIKNALGLPVETYLRLLAPLYVADKTLLYLDIDIVCQGDITRIMEEVNAPRAVYAVQEYDENYKTIDKRYWRSIKTRHGDQSATDRFFQAMFSRLEMSHPVHFFNSGVMLLDLELWREEKLTERLLAYIASVDSLHAPDQDAINHVLDGRFGALHPRWNNAVVIDHGVMTGYSPEQVRQALRHPVLRHYTGFKQWTWVRLTMGDGAWRYWKYRRRTPWPAWHPSEPLTKVLKDIYWIHCKRFWAKRR